jgi:hypothetical protein
MRTLPIIGETPSFDLDACIVERNKDMLVEAFVAQAAIEGLDEAVLCCCTPGDIVPVEPAERPAQHRRASQLAAIVHWEAVMVGD